MMITTTPTTLRKPAIKRTWRAPSWRSGSAVGANGAGVGEKDRHAGGEMDGACDGLDMGMFVDGEAEGSSTGTRVGSALVSCKYILNVKNKRIAARMVPQQEPCLESLTMLTYYSIGPRGAVASVGSLSEMKSSSRLGCALRPKSDL